MTMRMRMLISKIVRTGQYPSGCDFKEAGVVSNYSHVCCGALAGVLRELACGRDCGWPAGFDMPV